MRILLTNDDGFDSPGIILLAAALREAGHRVFVVAPASNQSGVSHSISFLNGPRKLTEIAQDTWVCEGTPADCVVIALLGGIPELCVVSGSGSIIVKAHPASSAEFDHSNVVKRGSPPDAIVSGINRGANLGTDIIYSGTVAAARQGALFNIPSLALSLVEGAVWNWDMAVVFAAERLAEMLSYWKPDSFVNVNIPNIREIPSSLVHAFPSLRYYNDSIDVYCAPNGDQYCFPRVGEVNVIPEQGSDWGVVEGNCASISEIFIHPVLLESVKGKDSGG